MRRFGLRSKFILLIVVLLTAIFSGLTLILIRNNTTTLRDRLSSDALGFAALATKPIGDTFNIYKDAGRIRILQQVERFTDLNRDIANVAVVDLDANVLFNQQPSAQINVTAEQAASFNTVTQTDSNGYIQQIIEPYREDFGLRRYAVVYQVSNDSITESTREIVRSVLLLSLISLLISSLITYWLINGLFLKPMRLLSRQALAISAGQLSQKIQARGNDEISDLAKAVNAMAETLLADIHKLQEVDALKTEFMMIASHNLRTPLTVINGYLELLKGMMLEPKLAEVVNSLQANSRRLSAFAEDMLTVSRIESGDTGRPRLEPGDIGELLRSLAQEATYLAREKQIIVSTDLPAEPLMLKINRAQMQVAIWNLIDNALKFTPVGGKIEIAALLAKDWVKIQVRDNGIGIAAAELPKLFTKFHRGTPTTSYDYEGTGLGLYISKLIISQHGGQIAVASQPGQGTTVTVSLPLAAA